MTIYDKADDDNNGKYEADEDNDNDDDNDGKYDDNDNNDDDNDDDGNNDDDNVDGNDKFTGLCSCGLWSGWGGSIWGWGASLLVS